MMASGTVVAFGGVRYPFAEDKKKTFMGMDVSIEIDQFLVPSGR